MLAGGVDMYRVLIAEDDTIIADMIERILVKNGYEVCGVAPSVDEAVALGREHRPDLALLDMRLKGGLGTEVAAQLCDGPRIGILYASGAIDQVIAVADHDACITKPFHFTNLLRALDIVAGMVFEGIAPTPPFPRGFHLLAPRKAPVGDAAHV
jgi:DNA-binding response OmpR family regulator